MEREVDSGHRRDKKEWWEGKWTPGNNNKDREKKVDHGYSGDKKKGEGKRSGQ
jgi:hypothetical protein